jgi:hypothetical protein
MNTSQVSDRDAVRFIRIWPYPRRCGVLSLLFTFRILASLWSARRFLAALFVLAGAVLVGPGLCSCGGSGRIVHGKSWRRRPAQRAYAGRAGAGAAR